MEPSDVANYPTRHGLMFALKGDLYVTRSLELYGEFSPAETRFFEQLVQPGMTVVEVGANIGAHTVPLARRCAPGPLYAFEPQQRVFQLLCANLVQNDVANAIALPEAVGAEAGFVRMPLLDYSLTGNFGGVSVLPPGAGTGVKTRLTTIDALGLAECHLIKIDVEGYEIEVLRGGRRTIARHRPMLYVENDRPAKQQEVISLIHKLGYRQYWHTPPLYDPANFNGRKDNIFEGLVSVNVFCVPAESADEVAGIAPIDPTNWKSPISKA